MEVNNFIDVANLIKDKLSYPSWSTESTYELFNISSAVDQVQIGYKTNQNKIYIRNFPALIHLDSRFAFVLGLIKGEGANALGNQTIEDLHLQILI